MKHKNKFLFISFSTTKWDSSWYVRQKLMNEFAKTEKVIYVNPREDLRKILKNLLALNNWRKIFSFIKRVNNNLILVESPWIFPKIYKIKFLDRIIDRLYHFFIRLIAEYFGRKYYKLLYIWEPDFSDFRKYYHSLGYVYHPYDMFEKYVDISHKIDNEVKLANEAIGFYTVSELLCEHYEKKVNRRPKLILNGVDDIYFQKGESRVLVQKTKRIISRFKKKIVFFGSIKGILDLDIIISSAVNLSDWDIIFIGELRYLNITKYDEKLTQLFALDNVHHIGPFCVDMLPYLLQKMDILILLYKQDPSVWTFYGGPAKLFECMALGKPIIATHHPALLNMQKYIKIVNSSHEFVEAVKRVGEFWTPQLLTEMVNVAKENTWAQRKKEILSELAIRNKNCMD